MFEKKENVNHVLLSQTMCFEMNIYTWLAHKLFTCKGYTQFVLSETCRGKITGKQYCRSPLCCDRTYDKAY